ncbi:MAG: hypothetical protein U1C73_06350, partial [Dietzia sp.]|nr:hypothetical protein [Dietzia sp.]
NVSFDNIGGVCGMMPNTLLVAAHRTNQSVGFSMVTNLTELLFPASMGWQRRYVADGYCVNAAGSGAWVRAESPVFWDKADSAERMPTPMCSTGNLLSRLVMTKVPTGVSCALGEVCWPGSQIYKYQLPATWEATSTDPEFVTCMRAGATCGEPEMDGELCVWGSVEIPEGWCAPDAQTDVVTTNGTDSGLRTSDPVDVSGTPVGVPVATGTPVEVDTEPPPDGGDGGTTVIVDVPIDDGGEEEARVICPSIEVTEVGGIPCLPQVDAACFGGNGWGWLNPVNYVIKPLKCLFIPTDPAGWIDDQRDKFEGKAPFSFAEQAFGVVDAATDPGVDATPFCLDGLSTEDLDSGEVCADVGASGLAVDPERQQWMLAAMLAFTFIIGVFSLMWMLW